MLPRLRPNQVRVSHVRCRGIRLSAPRTAAAAIDPSIIGFFPVCTIFVRNDGLRKLSVSNIIISVLGLYEDNVLGRHRSGRRQLRDCPRRFSLAPDSLAVASPTNSSVRRTDSAAALPRRRCQQEPCGSILRLRPVPLARRALRRRA
jgi:hypothetical protein